METISVASFPIINVGNTLICLGGEIHDAMAKIQMDISPVGKDGTNKEQNFKYRSIEGFMNACSRAMAAHGVTITALEIFNKKELASKTATGKDKFKISLTILWIFQAKDGSFRLCTMGGEGEDFGDKAEKKAISASYKYALMTSFTIPTKDLVDGDGESIDADEDDDFEVWKMFANGKDAKFKDGEGWVSDSLLASWKLSSKSEIREALKAVNGKHRIAKTKKDELEAWYDKVPEKPTNKTSPAPKATTITATKATPKATAPKEDIATETKPRADWKREDLLSVFLPEPAEGKSCPDALVDHVKGIVQKEMLESFLSARKGKYHADTDQIDSIWGHYLSLEK